MSTLHVLQICPHDTPPFADLCRGYARAVNAFGGVCHTIYLGQGDAGEDPLVRYLQVDNLARGWRLRRRLREALQVLPQVSWDLVLCHRYRAFRTACAAGLPAERTVVLAHEYNMLANWRRRLHRLALAHQVRFAGVSPPVAEQLGQVTGFVALLPNVIDQQHRQAQRLTRQAARQALGLPEQGALVAVVGRLHYKKRPLLALQAFQAFAQTQPPGQPQAQLVFVGDGPARWQRQLQGEQVHLAGFVPDAANYVQAFDAVLHTGDVEAFGMVILEAMSAGVPVVAPPGGGPEYVLGPLGFYPAGDSADDFAAALARALAADPAVLVEQGSQRTREMFDIDAISRRVRALIDFVAMPETDPFAANAWRKKIWNRPDES